MRIDELEAALHDVATSEPTPPDDVYPKVLHTARRRRMRRGAATAIGAILCTLAVAVGIVALTDGDPSRTAVSSAPSTAGPFRPASRVEGDKLVVPVTFLAGGSAEIVLPVGAVNPDALTFVPGGAISWSGAPELGRSLEISRGTIKREFAGRKPRAMYRGASGDPVAFYADASRNDSELNYLAFQFGDWIVKVWDYPKGDPRGPAMTDAERRTWAAHLDGHVTRQGFLVLDPTAPLANAPVDSPDARLIEGRSAMGIIFGGCSPSELHGQRNEHGYYGYFAGPMLCNPDLEISVSMTGDFRRAADSFEIRNLVEPLPRRIGQPWGPVERRSTRHLTPGALVNRVSAVTRAQPSCSASAT